MNKPVFGIAVLVSTLALVAGCSSTDQARSVQTDQFLAPYKALLQEDHSGDRARLHYFNPDARWTSYDKIELLPVQLFNDPKSDLGAKQEQQLQTLVDGFYAMFYKRLGNNYTMVETPGPGVLQVQVAVSHGEPSQAGLAFISKLPPARVADTIYHAGTGKPAFSGGVTLEIVIKDAMSGTLLAAAADRRVGSMRLFKPHAFDNWGDVKNALQAYTDIGVQRLCKATKNCRNGGA